MHGGETLPLAGSVESSKLMATQGQVAVAPLHIGTRTLKHRGESLGLIMELVLSLRAQCAQDATGGNPRGAKPLGEFPKRFAIADAASLGHAIEIIRGNQLGVHGGGGLDHGVGHPLLLLYDVKAPNSQNSNEFKALYHYPPASL